MSDTIAIEAEAQLPEQIEPVTSSESIPLTGGGIPIAKLIPQISTPTMTAREAIAALLEFRERHRLVGETVADLVREARGE